MTDDSAETGASTQTTDSPAPDRRRVDGRTLWEKVGEQLREDILSGDLAPGTVLSEVALAESFGISRGPIREALGRLATEGLVTIRPRRGAVVSELTQDEFIESYQVREALETLAIRLAVPRMGAPELERLHELHRQMIEYADRDEVNAFFDANSKFHDVFIESSGNRRLAEMHQRLLDQTGRYLAHSLALRGSLGKSVAEHEAILGAVEAGDVESAVRLMADHIEVPQRIEGSDEHQLTLDQPDTNTNEGK